MTDKNKPNVQGFFDEATNTISYVVSCDQTKEAAIIDSVLDFDQASGRTSTVSAGKLIDYVRSNGLKVRWVLETHVHADHLSAAPYLKQSLGGEIIIGSHITQVQNVFGDLFNVEPEFCRNGAQFDRLVDDGDSLDLGAMTIEVLHTPGHTPACVSYVIGDAVFVGDTVFMPDYGTARCDFPGGDAAELYRSIHKLFALPDETRLYVCHDYKAPGRDHYAWETTVGAERARNIHVGAGVSQDEFVAMRTKRDATLSMPQLILPSVQVNMRAGKMPPAEANGTRYLKLPIDAI